MRETPIPKLEQYIGLCFMVASIVINRVTGRDDVHQPFLCEDICCAINEHFRYESALTKRGRGRPRKVRA